MADINKDPQPVPLLVRRTQLALDRPWLWLTECDGKVRATCDNCAAVIHITEAISEDYDQVEDYVEAIKIRALKFADEHLHGAMPVVQEAPLQKTFNLTDLTTWESDHVHIKDCAYFHCKGCGIHEHFKATNAGGESIGQLYDDFMEFVDDHRRCKPKEAA